MAAFAKELYDNRLSVLQNSNDQDTGFLLTEQDELEYEKLRTLSKMPSQQHYAEEDKIELSSNHQFIQQEKEQQQQQQTAYNENQQQHVDLQLNEENEENQSPSQQQSDLRQHDRKGSTTSMNTSNCSCASRLSRFKELLDVDLGVVDILEQEESHQQQQQQQQRVKVTKSLGLFGSLRQVTNRTRSQSASGGIRGLVRSLSTTVQRSSTSPSLSQLSQKMSPAAVAAIQHHTGKDDDDDDDFFKESGKGMRMLSQLVGRVRRSSRKGTKRINMDTPSSPSTNKTSNERSKIVRRTIIYVPPDTENFMKTIEQQQQSAFSHNSLSSHSHHLSSSTIQTSIPSAQEKQEDNQLKGIELREMSDGSVSWGIVKKDGNRKSFYDPSNRESKYAVEEQDDYDINEHLLELLSQQCDNTSLVSSTPPPPVPKRSPQRQQQQQQAAHHISTVSNKKDSSTTDIYYAAGTTLPSLLQMISEQEKLKHSPSVEEQLDEVIRAFSCSSDE